MKKIDLGQTVQLLANIGVLAGIVFLALEVNQNTSAAQASSREAVSLATIDWLMQVSGDPETLSFWRQALTNPSELDANGQLRRNMIAYAVAESWEMAFAQWQRGVLSDADWEKWDSIILNYKAAPGFEEFWDQSKGNLGSAFREYVDQLSGEPNFTFPTD